MDLSASFAICLSDLLLSFPSHFRGEDHHGLTRSLKAPSLKKFMASSKFQTIFGGTGSDVYVRDALSQ